MQNNYLSFFSLTVTQIFKLKISHLFNVIHIDLVAQGSCSQLATMPVYLEMLLFLSVQRCKRIDAAEETTDSVAAAEGCSSHLHQSRQPPSHSAADDSWMLSDAGP